MRLGVALANGIGVAFVVVFFAALVARAQRRRSGWASLALHDNAPPAAPEHRDPAPAAPPRTTGSLAPRLTSRAP
jgi:hypothetical protein